MLYTRLLVESAHGIRTLSFELYLLQSAFTDYLLLFVYFMHDVPPSEGTIRD